jgi:hypothetical protein
MNIKPSNVTVAVTGVISLVGWFWLFSHVALKLL